MNNPNNSTIKFSNTALLSKQVTLINESIHAIIIHRETKHFKVLFNIVNITFLLLISLDESLLGFINRVGTFLFPQTPCLWK